MKKVMEGLVLNYLVQFVKSYWDDFKEDMVAPYWEVVIVSGLEDYCRKICGNEVRPKDLFVSNIISHTSPEDAMAKLKKELQEMGLSGKLHKVTLEEAKEIKRQQGYIVID